MKIYHIAATKGCTMWKLTAKSTYEKEQIVKQYKSKGANVDVTEEDAEDAQ